MNWAKLFEIVVGDILIASIISAIFVVVSNKHSDKNEQMQEKNMQEIKNHIDLKLRVIEVQIEKKIVEERK